MKRTAIFYHPSFSRKSYMTVGNRLADFPEALDPLLQERGEKLVVFESKPVDLSLVLKVHTSEMIEMVKRDPFCSTAWHSVGGVVEASERIMRGEFTNAFCFIGAGGHHAGKNYFWGACCFNDVVISIVNMREKGLARRFAILDTDAHHGDGSRELLMDDPDVLHLCLCDREWESADGTKVDYDVTEVYYGGDPDGVYLTTVEKALKRVISWKPDLFFWYFGFDTYFGDYGSLGLSRGVFLEIGRACKEAARSACQERIQVVLAGGALREMATWIIPRVIAILTED